MGNFRIEVDGIGGHGCCREVGNGEKAEGCGQPSCPDCIARRFVEELRKTGVFNINYGPAPRAVLTHWPGQPDEVKDDLLTGIRSGSFR